MAIEEYKDIAKLSFDELSGSLQAREVRINRTLEKPTEKVLYMKREASNTKEADRRGHRGTFKGSEHGRGQGRGLGASPKQ